MDLSKFLWPFECPKALRRWADALVGCRQGKRRVAGWRWDGVSDEVVLLLAPQGHRMEKIPDSVWRSFA